MISTRRHELRAAPGIKGLRRVAYRCASVAVVIVLPTPPFKLYIAMLIIPITYPKFLAPVKCVCRFHE